MRYRPDVHNGRVEYFTSWHTPAAALIGMRERLPAQTIDRVTQAIDFALAMHGDQRRPTGAPYIEHLLEALEALVAGAGVTDPDVLIAAVLHDVVEDTPCGNDEVAERFGPRAAELVGWVTIPEAGPGDDKLAVKLASFGRLAGGPRDAILVKLADRLSNVQRLRKLSPERQRFYYAQTVSYIVPLASTDPWFAAWYRHWQAAHADLAAAPTRSPSPHPDLGQVAVSRTGLFGRESDPV
jgi:(p)ppGpp synthase/HD superfamily hydrolase